ncbi:hypothetical protein Tco_0548562 [Tanacetum coccineum]
MKIQRIHACTHQRPQRNKAQYVVSREDQYTVLEIWNKYNILEDIKRGPYSKKLQYAVSNPWIRQITLVDETQGRYGDEDMFGVHDLDGDEVVVESEIAAKKKDDKVNVVKEVVSVAEETVNAATIIEDEITLAQALTELKSVKPKVTTATTTTTKGILLQEPSESITTTTTIPSKDKGKSIMVEEPLKMKKKDQINFDEQEAIILQAEFDEEVRLAREKYEANVTLIRVTAAQLMLLVYTLLLLVFRVNAAITKLQLLKD